MKLFILSDTRLPTTGSGGHGLGRKAFDIATIMKKRGHDVTLCAGKGSEWDGELLIHADERTRYDEIPLLPDAVYLDLSHHHEFSAVHSEYKGIDWIVDGECTRNPRYVLVATEYDKQFFKNAVVVPSGVDVDSIPFCKRPSMDYLVFSAKIHPHKGFLDALEIHKRQSIQVKFVGERWVNDWLPDWRNTLSGKDYYSFVGNAVGLLHPINHKNQLGGGRMPLEAAAMGCPAIVYDFVSCRDHVEHGISGWIVGDLNEMIDAVQDLPLIDRKKCREWVADTHSLNCMASGIEDAIEKFFGSVNNGA